MFRRHTLENIHLVFAAMFCPHPMGIQRFKSAVALQHHVVQLQDPRNERKRESGEWTMWRPRYKSGPLIRLNVAKLFKPWHPFWSSIKMVQLWTQETPTDESLRMWCQVPGLESISLLVYTSWWVPKVLFWCRGKCYDAREGTHGRMSWTWSSQEMYLAATIFQVDDSLESVHQKLQVGEFRFHAHRRLAQCRYEGTIQNWFNLTDESYDSSPQRDAFSQEV